MDIKREETISYISNSLSVFMLGILAILSAVQTVGVCREYMAVNLDLHMDASNAYAVLAPILYLFLYMFGCINGLKKRLSILITGRILSSVFIIEAISLIISIGVSDYADLTGLIGFYAVCRLAAACSTFLLFCKEKRRLVWVIILYAVAVNGIVKAATNSAFCLEIIQDNGMSWDNILAMDRNLANIFFYIWTILQVSLLIHKEHIMKKINTKCDSFSLELKYHMVLALLHFLNVLIVIPILGTYILPNQLLEPFYMLFTFVASSVYYVVYGFPLVAIVGLVLSIYRFWSALRLRKIPYILWVLLSILELFAYCFLFFFLGRL